MDLKVNLLFFLIFKICVLNEDVLHYFIQTTNTTLIIEFQNNQAAIDFKSYLPLNINFQNVSNSDFQIIKNSSIKYNDDNYSSKIISKGDINLNKKGNYILYYNENHNAENTINIGKVKNINLITDIGTEIESIWTFTNCKTSIFKPSNIIANLDLSNNEYFSFSFYVYFINDYLLIPNLYINNYKISDFCSFYKNNEID